MPGHPALAGVTERVSVSSKGVPTRGDAFDGGMSDAGRYVVFSSAADDLVPHDANRANDIFLRDRALGTTARLSVGPGEREGDGVSYFAAISANGRHVLFTSNAGGPVPGDGNLALGWRPGRPAGRVRPQSGPGMASFGSASRDFPRNSRIHRTTSASLLM